MAGSTASITLTPNPISIAADGAATSTISAYVYDGYGKFVADGTTVSFSKNLGTLSSASATTNIGLATVTLTSGTTEGTATINASAGGVTQSTTPAVSNVEFSIFSAPSGAANQEEIDGRTSAVPKTTQLGVASVTLSSGQVSGTAKVKVVVNKDKDGAALSQNIQLVCFLCGIRGQGRGQGSGECLPLGGSRQHQTQCSG